MKLNSPVKRAGVALILFSLAILVILIIIKAVTTQELIAYHMPNGQVFYYKRGPMENMLVEGLEMVLIIFPLFACGVALLMGWGSRIVNWIKHGHDEENG